MFSKGKLQRLRSVANSSGPLLLLAVRGIFFVLGKVAFIIIMLLIGFYALYYNDQGQDLMVAFGDLGGLLLYHLLFVVFLVIWANTTWNVSRVLLSAANLTSLILEPADNAVVSLPAGVQSYDSFNVRIDVPFAKVVYRLYIWVPRLLLLVPYLIYLSSYLKRNSGQFILPVLIALLAMTHLLIITAGFKHVFSKSYAKKNNEPELQRILDMLKGEKDFLAAFRKVRVLKIAVITGLFAIGAFIIALVVVFINPVNSGSPGLILLSAFIIYTIIGFLLNLLIFRVKVPVFLILLIIGLIFSAYNNNHAVTTLMGKEDSIMLAQSRDLADSVYFENWLAYKIKTGVYAGLKDSDTAKGKSTIFIVAAEGGGIRDCYWTEVVLKRLQEMEPSFYNRTFAVTGVSGGSIGLGFYYNYLYRQNKLFRQNGFHFSSGDTVWLDRISSADYLSRVTFGLLYPDLLQRFLPFKINTWDRGRMLAGGFDEAFSSAFSGKESLLSNNYLQMWSGPDRYSYPAILFNSLYVEQGTKAVFSPYRLSATYYPDALDILTTTKRSVPIKEAMVSSARFPFVTSPGLLMYDGPVVKTSHGKSDTVTENTKLGHLIDGGGFDNKAIQTAEETALMIKARLYATHQLSKYNVKIIYIGFGAEPLIPGNDPATAAKKVTDTSAAPAIAAVTDTAKTAEPAEALGRFYELAPVAGGVKMIFRWIYSAHAMTVRLDPEMDVINFGLRAKIDGSYKLPLGWYLSPYSKDRISTEINDSHLDGSFKQFKNYMSPVF